MMKPKRSTALFFNKLTIITQLFTETSLHAPNEFRTKTVWANAVFLSALSNTQNWLGFTESEAQVWLLYGWVIENIMCTFVFLLKSLFSETFVKTLFAFESTRKNYIISFNLCNIHTFFRVKQKASRLYSQETAASWWKVDLIYYLRFTFYKISNRWKRDEIGQRDQSHNKTWDTISH